MRIAAQLSKAHHLRIKRFGTIEILHRNREVNEA
jgi:hypothetical protein